MNYAISLATNKLTLHISTLCCANSLLGQRRMDLKVDTTAAIIDITSNFE